MPADFNSLPPHIQKQLDGRSRIVCSWGDLWDHAETILAVQPNVRVKLTDWPEIDLGDTRRDAKRAIGRQCPGVRFSLPDEEDYDD